MFAQLLVNTVWEIFIYSISIFPELLFGFVFLTLVYGFIYGTETWVRTIISDNSTQATANLVVTLMNLFLWFWVSLIVFQYAQAIRNATP